MHISLANLLTFPPVNTQPGAGKLPSSSEPQPSNDARAAQRRGPGRVVPVALPPKVQPQAAVPPLAATTASVVTIGQRQERDEGVTYTRAGTIGTKPALVGLPDLENMTLEKQLQVGRHLGVFTKITLHNDGVVVAKPEPVSPKPPEFVAAAVATIKDFQEGLAKLTQNEALYI